MLVYIHDKKYQKIVESSIISNHHTIKQRLVFFSLSPYLVRLVQESFKIPYLKVNHHHLYILGKKDRQTDRWIE